MLFNKTIKVDNFIASNRTGRMAEIERSKDIYTKKAVFHYLYDLWEAGVTFRDSDMFYKGMKFEEFDRKLKHREVYTDLGTKLMQEGYVSCSYSGMY